MDKGANSRGRGLPIALLAVLIMAWVGARAALWDNPIAYSAQAMAASDEFADQDNAISRGAAASGSPAPAPQSIAYAGQFAGGPYPLWAAIGKHPYPAAPPGYGYPGHYAQWQGAGRGQAAAQVVYYPVYQAGPQPAQGTAPDPQAFAQLQRGGFARAPELSPSATRFLSQSYALGDISRFAGQDARRTGQVSRPGSGAGLPVTQAPRPDRWMLDVFGFYRQGSSALSIPQGRSPIYGASQLSANLQWRAKPSSSHDPRIFLRAYQAQVEGGESEIAAGVSARPIGKLPVRLFGELRATQSPAVSDLGLDAQTKFRPAAYAVSELAPIKLPMGFALETYGAAGYVAGSPSTYFLDGQAIATRELVRIGKPGAGGAVSVGGGVWGGAQRDAKRLDIGPTLRFDVDIGKLPARVSVDYREQVAGDAEPDSGVAATVSTRF